MGSICHGCFSSYCNAKKITTLKLRHVSELPERRSSQTTMAALLCSRHMRREQLNMDHEKNESNDAMLESIAYQTVFTAISILEISI